MGKIKIGIIGGGASSVLLLAAIARREDAGGFEIDVFDRTGRFGHGIAYSTVHDCHLLNVRAANMSAFADDKDDFALWAGAKGYAPPDFVPRVLYAEYLQEKLDQARARVSVRFVEDDIVSSRRDGSGYVFKGAQEYGPYDHAVLASGNVRALRPRVEGDVAGYFDDPWSADFDAVLKAKTIALIGSGLSAVDMIVALKAKGFKGKIGVYSRRALLPCVHAGPCSYPAFLKDVNISPLELLRAIRREIKKADVPWQAVIDSLRGQTNEIWRQWNEGSRAVFMKRLLTYWNVHRHRMAPEIAAAVEEMRAAGWLDFIKADVRGLKVGPVVVTRGGEEAFDAVINCLGYRYDEPGREYDVSAKIGPARFGELFETTAIPEIRAQAVEIAALIR